jgi:hypothetical protein
MLEFRQGFFAELEACKLSEKQAAYMWKRAMEYPGTEDMLKQLNMSSSGKPEQPEMSPEQLQQLSELINQQKIQEELTALKNQLGV